VAGFLSEARPRRGAPAREAEPAPPAFGSADVREEAIRFAGGRLFGILSKPPSSQPRTCVLLLTIASHHRIGPNRLHTRWARELPGHGIATLRFDVSGTGDSEPNETGRENAPYALDQVADVSAAVDLLRGRGFERFVAVGVCSGAYLAWHAALADARLSGVVLINPQTFTWKPGDLVEIGGARKRAAGFKSTRFYRRALFDAATWKRLFSGQINVPGIGAEVAGRLASRARRAAAGAFARLLGKGAAKGPVLEGFEALAARAADVLLVFGQEDVGVDYIESHLGPGGARMKGTPAFRMLVLEGSAEHTFGQMWAQALLSQILVDHLCARFR
jgi:pimeloyl-ACP methyl ester carboxylesterase